MQYILEFYMVEFLNFSWNSWILIKNACQIFTEMKYEFLKPRLNCSCFFFPHCTRFLLKGKTTVPPSTCIPAALHRLALACLYLVTFQLLGFIIWDDYLLTDEFASVNFFKRALLLGVWGRYTLYKYITCWLFAEGACILFGKKK